MQQAGATSETLLQHCERASERSSLSPKRGKGKKKTAGKKPRGSKKSSAAVLFQGVGA